MERDSKRERVVRITFDKFLRLAVEAWKAGLPYHRLVFDIPEYEINLISSLVNLPTVHARVRPFVIGYSSESDREVDEVNDSLSDSEDESDEVLMVLGYPFFNL